MTTQRTLEETAAYVTTSTRYFYASLTYHGSLFDGEEAVARLAEDAAREAGLIADSRSDRDKASHSDQIEEIKL